jgi:hypothetical protein
MRIERLLVRLLSAGDEPKVQRMRKALWPDNSDEDNEQEVAAYVRGMPPEPLDGVLFVCELPGSGIVGFCEASLRSYAEGCDPSRPVGYIEGWSSVSCASGRKSPEAKTHAGTMWMCRQAGGARYASALRKTPASWRS